jgi:hypothetical protein
LTGRITRWEGVAGSWIAHVEVRNPGTTPCLLPAVVRPQLVDAKGAILIDAATTGTASPSAQPSPGSSKAAPQSLAAGATVTTEIRVGNWCGPAPATPLTIALAFPAGGRLVAAPFSATDETVPACMAGPGSAGSIEIQPWGS